MNKEDFSKLCNENMFSNEFEKNFPEIRRYILFTDIPSTVRDNEIQEYFRKKAFYDNLELRRLTDKDFTEKELEVNNSGTITSLKGGKINLRRKRPTIIEGAICVLKDLPSPKMFIETITSQSKHDLAQCIWFDNNQLRRETFLVYSLKPVEEEPEEKVLTTPQERILALYNTDIIFKQKIDANYKIEAIKQLRVVFNWGLKEAKDEIERFLETK